LSARIVSVVDVYDALASERCYKQALSHENSIEIIAQASGTHHDPEIVKALLTVQEDFKDLKNRIDKL
jgi:putative two-component system response regulator